MTQPTAESLPSLGKGKIPFLQEMGLLIVLAILYLFFSIDSRNLPSTSWNPFFSMDNQFNGISRSMSIYAIMSVGMSMVIITGGIDISVGSILAVAQLSAGMALRQLPLDCPWYTTMLVAFLVPMAIGGLCGLLNGTITTVLGLHPFIVTLATLSILRGICVRVFPSNLPGEGYHIPKVFTEIMRYGFGHDLELVPAIVMLLVMVGGAIFLQTTVAGRETYAVGGNAEAARFSGIRVGWVTMRVYIIMGICCGIAAIVQLGEYGTTAINAGDGYELKVIASAVVGGAALTGGRGTALGALLGAMVIAVIENGILTMGWHSSYTKIIVGTSIILAVSVDRLSGYLIKLRRRAPAHQ